MLALASLVGSVQSQAAEVSGMVFAVDVPMVESDGFPCVEARIGEGQPLLFAIDTGNVNSALDTSVARSAGLALTPLPPPTPADLYRTNVPVLRIGSLSLHAKALVLDFAKNQLPTHIGGTLAYTAFKDRILQLDFVAHRVRISDALTSSVQLPKPDDSISTITFGTQGPPIVVARGFEVEGKAITAQLDTMYTGSTLIYTASLARLGYARAAATQEAEFFPFTDGGVKMKVVHVPSESFHDSALGGNSPKLYFPTPDVHEPDGLFDGTVGLDLLRNSVLTLDFHDMRISVVGPAT